MAKDFKKPKVDMAELNFISQVETTKQKRVKTTPAADVPEGYKLNPMYLEKRTKRVQLILQPSLYDKAKAIADAEGISFNEYCSRILEQAIGGK